ncbi:MAG: hypothetical protein K0B02_04035 [DPANN group archaeon]|nr:hypothetical protein [DPANN group archaeon]
MFKELGLRTGVYTNGRTLKSNFEIFDELYTNLDYIQIGVHEYTDTDLENLFGLIEHKIENTEFDDKILNIHFIINEETKKRLLCNFKNTCRRK